MSVRTRWAVLEARAKRDPNFYKSPGTPEQLAELRKRADEEERLNEEFCRRQSSANERSTS